MCSQGVRRPRLSANPALKLKYERIHPTPVIPAGAKRRAGTQGPQPSRLGPCVLPDPLSFGLMVGDRSPLGPWF
jgi:hypothetical protein